MRSKDNREIIINAYDRRSKLYIKNNSPMALSVTVTIDVKLDALKPQDSKYEIGWRDTFPIREKKIVQDTQLLLDAESMENLKLSDKIQAIYDIISSEVPKDIGALNMTQSMIELLADIAGNNEE